MWTVSMHMCGKMCRKCSIGDLLISFAPATINVRAIKQYRDFRFSTRHYGERAWYTFRMWCNASQSRSTANINNRSRQATSCRCIYVKFELEIRFRFFISIRFDMHASCVNVILCGVMKRASVVASSANWRLPAAMVTLSEVWSFRIVKVSPRRSVVYRLEWYRCHFFKLWGMQNEKMKWKWCLVYKEVQLRVYHCIQPDTNQ